MQKSYLMGNHGIGWESDEVFVTEWCSECGQEVTFARNIKEGGYKAFCPNCGARLMLCDECQHRTGGERIGDCDYCKANDSCMFNPAKPIFEIIETDFTGSIKKVIIKINTSDDPLFLAKHTYLNKFYAFVTVLIDTNELETTYVTTSKSGCRNTMSTRDRFEPETEVMFKREINKFLAEKNIKFIGLPKANINR